MASNGSGKEIEIQVSPLVSEDGIKQFNTDLQSKLDNATKDIAVTVKPTVDLTEVKNSLKAIYTDADTTTGITLRKVGFSIMSQGNIRKALQETISKLNVEADLNVTPKKIDVSSLNTIFTDKDKVIGVTLQNVALSAKSKGHLKTAIEDYLGTTTFTSPLTISPDSVTIDRDAIAKSLADLSISIPTLSLSSDRVTMTSDEVAKIKKYLDERLQGIRFNAYLAVPDVNLSEVDSSLQKFFDTHVYPLSFDGKDLAETEKTLDTTFSGVAERLRNQVSDALYGTVDYILKNKTIPVTVKIRPDQEYSKDMSKIKEDIKNQIESGIDFTLKEVKYSPNDITKSLKTDWDSIEVPTLKLSTFDVNLTELNKVVAAKFNEMTVPSVLISSAHFKDDKVLSELEASINGYLANKSFELTPKINFKFDADKETPEKKVKKDIFDRLESYIQSRKIGVPIDVDATIDNASSKKAAETISKFAGTLNRNIQLTITTTPDIANLKSDIDTATADRTTTVSFRIAQDKDFKSQYAAIKQADTHKIKLEIENQQDIQNKLDAIQAKQYSAKLFLDTTELDTKITSLEKGSLYKVVPTFWYDNTRGKSALDALKGEAAAILGTWEIPFNVYPKFNETKLSNLKTTVSDLYGKRQLSITTDLDKEAYRSTKEAIDSLFKDASTPVKSQLETVQKLVDKTYAQMVKMAQDSIKEGTKQTESEKKRRKEVHNQTMADIKKEDTEARATLTARINTEKGLRENQTETTLRNIERERSAYKDVLTDLSKFKLDESVGADLVKDFKEIKGTLSTEVEKANRGLEDAISLNKKNYLESVQRENDYFELRMSNLKKVRDLKLAGIGATSLEERNSLIEYYTEREMKEVRSHEERLSTLNKELEVSNSNSKIESTKAIAAAEEVASTRFSLFQAEYETRLANADAIKAKEIADAKEVASKRESFLSGLQGTVDNSRGTSDAKVSQDNTKLQSQLTQFYAVNKYLNTKESIETEKKLQDELNGLIRDANKERQLSEVQLSKESEAVKAIKTEYINLFTEMQKGYDEEITKATEKYKMEKFQAEDLRKSRLDTAESNRQKAISEAIKTRAEGYEKLAERIKNIRKTLEKNPNVDIKTFTADFVEEFEALLKKTNSDYEKAMSKAGTEYNDAVEKAEKAFTKSEKERTSLYKKEMTQKKLAFEEDVRNREAEKKGKLEIQISTEKAEAELAARKEANLKYIANLESKFAEERKARELSDQKEVFDAERKKRAEQHASRLAEIKEETDAYKASVEARTKERVSGYLTESDLGVTKRTDSLSKTKDQISSIREAIAEGLKGADQFEAKWSDVFTKLANKGRERAEKAYSNSIENIDKEEKAKLDSLQASLIEELKNNTEITQVERENIEKSYSEKMEAVRKEAEEERASAKEALDLQLNAIDTREVKNNSYLARKVIDEKAAIEETKSAEISAIVEAYNKRKAHIDAQLNWLNKYFDTEKKRIDENSAYRRNKAKLNAEYEEGLQKAQSEYNTKVYQGTTSTETEAEIAKANTRSEAKLEKQSILSSDDIDAIKKLKTELVDTKVILSEMAVDSRKAIKDRYITEAAEEDKSHAEKLVNIANQLEQDKARIKETYDEEMKSLQKREDALRKSLSMEKEGTISWSKLKKEAAELVAKREELVEKFDEEIDKLEREAEVSKRNENERHEQVVANKNKEKEIALNDESIVQKELLAYETARTNKAMADIKKEEDAKKEAAKKTQEELDKQKKRVEDNLNYVSNLESKFIEERKSKELSAQKEVLDAERKGRAAEHASRLAEIKEETDNYKASVEARTKERVSGYLTESDLGTTNRTDSLSKTKDQISSIREAISEGLKGADECEKKWSDVYSKISNKGRENAEKVYSKRIENIDKEEKTQLESLQSILLHELEMNTDISQDERETIEKHYSEQMKSVSETAEKERNSAKETLEQRLRNLETYEAKASASVSKITVDKKASIVETKSAEISSIVESYNKRKAHIDAQLRWLNNYFDTEKKHIDEVSAYRRNKAKLDAEYEEGLRRAQSEYDMSMYQGTSSINTDLAIKKANIKSEAKLEQDSIFSSSDIDDIKLLKSMLVDAKAEIKEMAAEEEYSIKKTYLEKRTEQARSHAQAMSNIRNELEQSTQGIRDRYAEELNALYKKEESLKKSLSMEKEETVSWKALKKESAEIVEQIKKTVAARDEEIKKAEDLAATKKRTEDEHNNKVVTDINSEKDIALNAVGTVSRELLDEAEKKTNKSLSDIQKVADTEKETAKKTQEEIARTREEAVKTYYALFDELEKRFQDLLKQRLDIIRAQNEEELKGAEIAFNYSRKQADIKRKGTNRTEDIYSKYTSQMIDDEARIKEKAAEDIAKINASSLDEEEKKKQISFVKDMARAEFKHNNEVRNILRRQEIADSLAETEYDNAIAKTENISDTEMKNEETRHNKTINDLKDEMKVLEGKRDTMSDKEYSSQMEDIQNRIADENKSHQEKEHGRKTTLETSKQSAEDDLRKAKRESKKKAQEDIIALNSKYNARKREKEREEDLRRDENSKTLKEQEDLNNQLMAAIAKLKENQEKVWDSERAEKEKQAKAEAEATEKALAHETDVYAKELNKQSELSERSRKLQSNYKSQVKSGKDTYGDTLKTIDTSQEQKKLEDESRTRIELEKEIANIRASSDSEEDKRRKINDARRRAAELNNHNTILRNIEVQKSRRLAFIELYKNSKTAAENKTHEEELSRIDKEKTESLKAIDEEFYQLEQNKGKLTSEEYNNIRRELEEKKNAIIETSKLAIEKENEVHNQEMGHIQARTSEAKRNVELRTTKKTVAENERYAKVTNKAKTPEEVKKEAEQATSNISEQISKLMSLFQKGVKLVWSNYTKYGKSSIQTISNLFKSTLQKTFQGSRKLNEVLGLSKGTSEVDSVTQALSKLKSQLLGIAGISISFKTILGTTDASSELVEMQNVVDTVFGDLKESVNTFAESANRAFGLTEFQAKKFSSIFGSMFKTSGVSVEASRDMGESLTALSADLASFFDADFTEAFDKVKSGLAGMIMPLRAYGIDLSVASMKQYMLDKGIQATWADLSIAQKQMVRYNYMLEHTTDMQGDFTKTIGSWANQLRLLKNQLRELAVIMGSFVEKVIYPLIVHLNSLLGVLIEVGKELQKTFGFEESDLLKQQGLDGKKRGLDIGVTYDDTEGTSDAIDATDDLTASTDKLTESKKKLQKENERQEASFDSLIKLSRQSTDANDASTKDNKDKKKKKGTGVDLGLEPLKYKGLDLSKAPIKLPKWAKHIIKWANEIKALFNKYKAKLTKGFEDLKKAWEPVLDKLSDAIVWLWQNILKPFLEWLLGTAIPKTMELLTALGGVVDSVLGPIGEAAKWLWEEILEPFFKAIGDKYVKWVEESTEKLKEWKNQFDELGTIEEKLDFLKQTIKNWFEETMQKLFGDRSKEILDNFYSMWNSVKDILGQVFGSQEDLANGKLFSDDFLEAVKNLAGAFVQLASTHFDNLLGLADTIVQNQVPLSEIAANLADNFGKIETMVFDGIKGFIDMLGEHSDEVQEVANALTDLLTTIGETVFTGITNTVEKLLETGVAADYIEIIKNFLNDIAKIVFKNVDELIEWLSNDDVKARVQDIAASLERTFDNITTFLSDHKDEILTLVDKVVKFVEFASEHPDAVIGMFGALLANKGLAAVIKTPLDGLLKEAGSFVLGKIKGFLPDIGSTLVSGITSLVAPLAAAVGLPVSAVIAIIAGAIAAIIAIVLNWDKIKEFFTKTVPTFFKEKVRPWLESIGAKLKAFVESIPDKIHDGIVAAAEKFGELLGKWYTFCTKKLPEILEYIGNWFLSLPDKIKAWWKDTKKAWKEGFQYLVDTVPGLVKDIYDKFKENFDSFVDFWKNLGKNIIDGIGDGIKNGISWIGDLAEDAAEAFLGGFRKEAEIHSPSKKACTLGEFLMKGLGNGIKNGMSDVLYQFNKVYEGTNDFISTLKDTFTNLQMSTLTSNLVTALDSMTLDAMGKAKERDLSSLFTSDATIAKAVRAKAVVSFDRNLGVSPLSSYNNRVNGKAYREANQDLVDNLTDSMMMALQDAGMLEKEQGTRKATVNIYLDSERIATKVIDIADSKEVRSGGL